VPPHTQAWLASGHKPSSAVHCGGFFFNFFFLIFLKIGHTGRAAKYENSPTKRGMDARVGETLRVVCTWFDIVRPTQATMSQGGRLMSRGYHSARNYRPRSRRICPVQVLVSLLAARSLTPAARYRLLVARPCACSLRCGFNTRVPCRRRGAGRTLPHT